MPITGYDSLCETNAKEIISRDKGNRQEHRARNICGKPVAHYQIDGVVIKKGNTCCDFALFIEDKFDKQVYLIELKGSDLTKAAQQIEATERALQSSLKGYGMNYRIVANKCKTQEIQSTEFRKYKLKWRRKLKYATGKMAEDI